MEINEAQEIPENAPPEAVPPEAVPPEAVPPEAVPPKVLAEEITKDIETGKKPKRPRSEKQKAAFIKAREALAEKRKVASSAPRRLGRQWHARPVASTGAPGCGRIGYMVSIFTSMAGDLARIKSISMVVLISSKHNWIFQRRSYSCASSLARHEKLLADTPIPFGWVTCNI